MVDGGRGLVLINVGKSTFYPPPLGGRGCSYYPVGREQGGMLGWDAVRGTRDERDEWRAAAERFRAAMREAEDAYWAVVRGKSRHLPGARRRRERAAERFREAAAVAEEHYAPLRAQIERRLAAAAEQQRLERAERERRWAVKRAEEEARQRVVDARKARCYEVLRREVWGWAVVGDESRGVTEIFVYRHDVRTEQPVPASSRRSARPLSGDCLELELCELRDESGLTDVRWERAARERVAAECSTPNDPVSFEDWWAIVSLRRWPSPQQVPPPPAPPKPGRVYGISGSDYGGFGGHGGFGGFGSY